MPRFLVMVDRLDQGVMDTHILFADTEEQAITRCVQPLPQGIGDLKVWAEPLAPAHLIHEKEICQLVLQLDALFDVRRDHLKFLRSVPSTKLRLGL